MALQMFKTQKAMMKQQGQAGGAEEQEQGFADVDDLDDD